MTRLLFFIFFFLLLNCSKKPIVIEKDDPVIVDMNSELNLLKADLKSVVEDNEKVKAAFMNPDIVNMLGPGLKREFFANEDHIKHIQQEINILEMRSIKRVALLKSRLLSAGQEPDPEKIIIKKEVDEYFQDKKINPIINTWKNRFRAASKMKPPAPPKEKSAEGGEEKKEAPVHH